MYRTDNRQLWTVASNVTAVKTANGSTVYYSYSTPIALELCDGQRARTAEKFSVTTSRHMNRFFSDYPQVSAARFAELLAGA